MTVRLLLADDHPVFVEGLSVLLGRYPDLEVVGTATEGRDAIRQAALLNPHVVLMDISMPGLNGIEAAARIREAHPEVQVIMLSMHDTAEHVYRALRAGAQGYLLKDSVGREVVEAIRNVSAGRRYLSTRIASLAAIEERLAARSDASPLESLSAREREVMQLVVEGKSSAEIAAQIHLSPKTVETYRSRLMQKLGVADVPALVKFALSHGVAT